MTHPKYRDEPGCDWCGGEPVTWLHVSDFEPGSFVQHRKLDERCLRLAGQEVADGILEPIEPYACVCDVKEPR